MIPAAIILGLLILIHELGHFIACRLSRVKVEKFSIGFGPELAHWQGKETRYAISLFPLGGFVKPSGESLSELHERPPQAGDYLAASLPRRMLIVVAGVIMNYLLAYVLFVGLFTMGFPVPGTKIGGFVEGYPAKSSGLAAGDRVLKINGQPVRSWTELTHQLEITPERQIELFVQRGRETLSLKVFPKIDEIKDIFGERFTLKRLGITPDPQAHEFEKYSFLRALKVAWDRETAMTLLTHKAIFYLLLGKLSPKTISGPLGIIAMTGNAAHLGLPYVLHMTASLSISLAVINLLPVPALDGGHFLFLLIEAFRRKKVSLKVQERATQVGFALLLMLMVFVIYNDLMNMEAFERIKGLFHIH